MTKVFPPRVLLLLVALAAVLVSSCSDGRKPVFPVTGQVFFERNPAHHATVFFHPVDDKGPKALRPYGKVDLDGNFQLSTYGKDDGAPAGEYIVTVVWKTESENGDSDEEQLIPARYMSPATSGLRARVQESPTQLEPFQLTK
jgi:hypothetical protein